MNVLARAVRGSLAAVFFAAGALGFASAVHAQTGAPAADFGSAPSGEIPILFNDHHVYAKPDHLKSGRVLAAIVRNNTILVPLRSMFEQTGATVAYDASTKTVDVSKPGADVKVTLGKPWVVINGDERPLDVPPMFYRGAIVVPLRVISEGMGAFVQWIPEKHLVVIRYLEQAAPAAPDMTPAPSPRPTAPASAAPTPTNTPVARKPKAAYETYVAGDYLIAPKIYNELVPGVTGHKSFEVKGAFEFPLFGPTWEVSANYRHFLYPHSANLAVGCAVVAACNTIVGSNGALQAGTCPSPGDSGCVTTVGYPLTQGFNGLGQVYVTAFTAQENDVDVHFGLRVLDPRIYLAVAGVFRNTNYLGYPKTRGFGFGIEKLPDLDQHFSLYGSAFYYPNVNGKYTFPTSALLGPLSAEQITLAYQEWKYEAGGTITLGAAFVDFGYSGIHTNAKQNAPSNTSIGAPYVGLGLHF